MPRERVSSIRKKRTNRKLVRKNTRRSSKKSIGKTRRRSVNKRRSVRKSLNKRRSVRRSLRRRSVRRSVNKSTRRKSLRKKSRNRRLYGGAVQPPSPPSPDPDFSKVIGAIKGIQESMKEELRRNKDEKKKDAELRNAVPPEYGADGDEAYRYLLEQAEKLREENKPVFERGINGYSKKSSIIKMYDLYEKGMTEYNRGNFIKARAYFQNIFILLNGKLNTEGDKLNKKSYPGLDINEDLKEPTPLYPLSGAEITILRQSARDDVDGEREYLESDKKTPLEIKDDAAEKIEIIATAQNELVVGSGSDGTRWEITPESEPQVGFPQPRKLLYNGEELGNVTPGGQKVGFIDYLYVPSPTGTEGKKIKKKEKVEQVGVVVKEDGGGNWTPRNVKVTSTQLDLLPPQAAEEVGRRKSLSGDSDSRLDLSELEEIIRITSSSGSGSSLGSSSGPGSESGSEPGLSSGSESDRGSQGTNDDNNDPSSSDLNFSVPASSSQDDSYFMGEEKREIPNTAYQARTLKMEREAKETRRKLNPDTTSSTSSEPSTSTDDDGISPIDRDYMEYERFLNKLKELENATDDDVDKRREEVLSDEKYGGPLRVLMEKRPELQSGLTHIDTIVGVGRKTSEYSQFLKKIDGLRDKGPNVVQREIKEDMAADKPQYSLANDINERLERGEELNGFIDEFLNIGNGKLVRPHIHFKMESTPKEILMSAAAETAAAKKAMRKTQSIEHEKLASRVGKLREEVEKSRAAARDAQERWKGLQEAVRKGSITPAAAAEAKEEADALDNAAESVEAELSAVESELDSQASTGSDGSGDGSENPVPRLDLSSLNENRGSSGYVASSDDATSGTNTSDSQAATSGTNTSDSQVATSGTNTSDSQVATSDTNTSDSQVATSGTNTSDSQAATSGTNTSDSQANTSDTNTSSESSEDGSAGRNIANTSSVSVSDTITGTSDNSTVAGSTEIDELQVVSNQLESLIDSNKGDARGLSEELAKIPTKEQRREFLEGISSSTSSEGSEEPQSESPSQKMAGLAIKLLELKKSNSELGSDTDSTINSSLSDEVLLNITSDETEPLRFLKDPEDLLSEIKEEIELNRLLCSSRPI